MFAGICATDARAQTYLGALRGEVRDAQGVIPGAEVILVNEDTNATRSAMTNEVGGLAVASVLRAPIRSASRYWSSGPKNIKAFAVAQSADHLDFVLEVGALEQITVVGETPLVGRRDAGIDARQGALKNLPIFGRNTFFAAISTAGVIQTGDPIVRYQDQSAHRSFRSAARGAQVAT